MTLSLFQLARCDFPRCPTVFTFLLQLQLLHHLSLLFPTVFDEVSKSFMAVLRTSPRSSGTMQKVTRAGLAIGSLPTELAGPRFHPRRLRPNQDHEHAKSIRCRTAQGPISQLAPCKGACESSGRWLRFEICSDA